MGAEPVWTRRGAAASLLAVAAGLSTAGRAAAQDHGPAEKSGRLQSRPGSPDLSLPPLAPGEAKLDFADRFALLYVPTGFRPQAPTPLLMFLHGNGGRATHVISGWKERAEKRGFILLAPNADGPTWRYKLAPAGADAGLLERALGYVFARATIDPQRLALAGKSDGSTMALSVGLPNGDLFSHIMCFSGGGIHASKAVGRPRLFFSHGHQDDILSFKRARELAGRLGTVYDVTFFDFQGGHIIPKESADAALAWFLG